MMRRAQLRENIFRMLFCSEFHEKKDIQKQCEMYLESMENAGLEEREYIENKTKEIIDRIPEIDKELNRISEGWPTKRMSKADLNILRLAYFEMKFDDDVPQKVAVDQAVELAKKYGGDESAPFVNGVLAKLF